jgi:hypothetical protein
LVDRINYQSPSATRAPHGGLKGVTKDEARRPDINGRCPAMGLSGPAQVLVADDHYPPGDRRRAPCSLPPAQTASTSSHSYACRRITSAAERSTYAQEMWFTDGDRGTDGDTVHSIGTTIHHIAIVDGLKDRLIADPAFIPRMDAPVVCVARTVRRGADLAGRTLDDGGHALQSFRRIREYLKCGEFTSADSGCLSVPLLIVVLPFRLVARLLACRCRKLRRPMRPGSIRVADHRAGLEGTDSRVSGTYRLPRRSR